MGVQAHQIVTGTACHLDAHLVHDALHHMKLDGVDILFIENVGNLVCPASFDLGQHLNVTLLSVTEGDDKPAKYPVMFRAADAMLLTKTDLLAVLDDFDPDKAESHLRNLANPAPVMRLSARKGAGHGELARLVARTTRRPARARGARQVAAALPSSLTARDCTAHDGRRPHLAGKNPRHPIRAHGQDHERVRRARAFHHPGRSARRVAAMGRAGSRPRLPGVHLSGRRRLSGDPARLAGQGDSGCFRRHAAGAGECEKRRGALAGRSAGRRCRRAADRQPAGSQENRAGKSRASGRVLRRRFRDHHRADPPRCSRKTDCRTISSSCCPGG